MLETNVVCIVIALMFLYTFVGICAGFGGGLTTMPLVTLMLPVKMATPLSVIVGTATALYATWLHAHHIVLHFRLVDLHRPGHRRADFNQLAVGARSNVHKGDLARTMQTHLAQINHIQLADNPGRHEPGTGEINYRFLFDHLDSIGYQGWVGCEYKPLTSTEAGLAWLKTHNAV